MPADAPFRLEFSKDDGYLAIYARFRRGKVSTTYEIRPGLAADVDREGRVLAVEVIRTFSTKARKGNLENVIDLDEIQRAVEKKFGVNLNPEFEQIREASRACSFA